MGDKEAAEASSAAKKKAVPVWFTEKFKKLPDFYNEFFEPAETESMHTCKICKEEASAASLSAILLANLILTENES